MGAWETFLGRVGDKKVCVAIPHTGTVSFHWAIRFKSLLMPNGTLMYSEQGLPWDLSREKIVEVCIKENVDEIVWVDSDTIPRTDKDILKLIEYDFPVVSGVYIAKKQGYKLPAVWKKINGEYHPMTLDNRGLHYADVIGMGFCKTKVKETFGKMKKPWFYFTLNRYVDGIKVSPELSEDFWYCEKLKEIGIMPIVDFDLLCDHIGTCRISIVEKDGKREVEMDVI